ncbi:MAG: hypothetical protein Q9228_002356 [Teloschistes exilis]
MAAKSFRLYRPEALDGMKLSQILQVRRSRMGTNLFGLFPCENIRPGQQLYRERAVAVVESPPSANHAEMEERLLGALVDKVCRENGLLSEELKSKTEALMRRASVLCPPSSKDHHFALNTAGHRQRRGFWHRIAMFNHSCIPNACLAFDDQVAMLTATKRIGVDEEIVIDYLAHQTKAQFNSPSELQAYLKARWGFTCACQLCSHDATIQDDAYLHRTSELGAVWALIKKQRAKTSEKQNQQINFLHGVVDSKLATIEDTYDPTLPARPNVARTWYPLACYKVSLGHWPEVNKTANSCLWNLGFRYNTSFSATSPSLFAQHGMATKEALRCLIFIWVTYLGVANSPRMQHRKEDREMYFASGLAARSVAKVVYGILVGNDESFMNTYEPIVFAAVAERCSLMDALLRLDHYGGNAVLTLRSMGVRPTVPVFYGWRARLSEKPGP